jgi:hypothetical protein
LNGLKSPVAEATFTYLGDRQCRITYRDNGNDTMGWTAKVSVAGELITRASDSSGNTYRQGVHASIVPNTFTARAALAGHRHCPAFFTFRILDFSTSCGCSVKPQHAVAKKAKAKPRRTAAPAI